MVRSAREDDSYSPFDVPVEGGTASSTLGTSNYVSPFSSSGTTEYIGIVHEIGASPESVTVTRQIDIDPLAPPKKVVVVSQVNAAAYHAFRSPQYLATLRRRNAHAIMVSVQQLKEHCDSPHFAVHTQGVLTKIRTVIRKLSKLDREGEERCEGNSCEVFRQIRDSLLRDGWQSYRSEAVRETVRLVLARLKSVDEVTMQDAFWAMEQLSNAVLNPCVGPAWSHGEEIKEEVPS